MRNADSLGIGGESCCGAGDAFSCRSAGGAFTTAGHASIFLVEVLSACTAYGLNLQFLAHSVCVHVEALRAAASVDGRVEYGIEGADCAGSLECELS